MNSRITVPFILASSVSVFAQEAAAAPSLFGQLGSIAPMMLTMFAVMYFFMILPEQKRAKAHRALMDGLKKNDKIVFMGGMHGVVNSVKDGVVMVKIADNTVVKINKAAVNTVITDASADDDKDSKGANA